MRYLVGFVFVLALVSAPLAVSAQAGEEGATPEPNLEEPAPSAEPTPEEPALQLKLDSAGVEVVPSPPRTADGYTLHEMELRVKRARIGLGVSSIGLVAGGLTMLAANAKCMIGEWTDSCNRIDNAGIAILSAGGAAMIATGILLGKRKRKLRKLEQAHYGTARRVQWDLARSRLVF